MSARKPLELTRQQILACRRQVHGLLQRVPSDPASLRRAAWAGLQDSMPRAARLSLHARVGGTADAAWTDPPWVQIWGPRFSAYVVAAEDRAVFTLGRLAAGGAARHRAEDLAERLRRWLDGREMSYGEAGRAIGVVPNALRHAAATGTVLIRWDGAGRPTVRSVERPTLDPAEARLELARRHLAVMGPSTPDGFARWAGVAKADGLAAYRALASEIMPVRTPLGDAWILAEREAGFRAAAAPAEGARLLPSGDAYFLLQGADRELLVPEPDRRAALWSARVWPGAILLAGELVGTWRREGSVVTASPWQRLSPAERQSIAAEAESLPLPSSGASTRIAWNA